MVNAITKFVDITTLKHLDVVMIFGAKGQSQDGCMGVWVIRLCSPSVE